MTEKAELISIRILSDGSSVEADVTLPCDWCHLDQDEKGLIFELLQKSLHQLSEAELD
jgi:hypothetical protein